jgi:hypothetical protein
MCLARCATHPTGPLPPEASGGGRRSGPKGVGQGVPVPSLRSSRPPLSRPGRTQKTTLPPCYLRTPASSARAGYPRLAPFLQTRVPQPANRRSVLRRTHPHNFSPGCLRRRMGPRRWPDRPQRAQWHWGLLCRHRLGLLCPGTRTLGPALPLAASRPKRAPLRREMPGQTASRKEMSYRRAVASGFPQSGRPIPRLRPYFPVPAVQKHFPTRYLHRHLPLRPPREKSPA